MIDDAAFRQVMSRFASGVTVVTTAIDDACYGLTVSSFASLSLEPRLALVCIYTVSPMHDYMLQAEQWAINILAHDQEDVSRHFAGPDKHDWSAIAYERSTNGMPWLDGALATLDCRLSQRYDGGDHSIFVGELQSVSVAETQPLVYFRGGYHSLGQA